MAEQRRLNPLLASLSVLLVATWLGLPFLRVAPNRLVSGQPVYLSSILQGVSWLLLCLALAGLFVAALMAAYRWSRLWCALVLVLSSALIPGSLWWAANHASALAHGGMVMTRTSFGSGFWIGLVLLIFLSTTALQQLKARPVLRLTVGLALLISVSAMVVSGAMGELSLFREYGQRKDDFSALLARHVEIVGLTFLFTVCIGLPLGWLAHAQAKVGRALLPVLNLVQTIPSIALFGLLTAPLAWLAASVPALGLAGISGVGLAPALIALTLYGLLPVVRGVLAGLQQVSNTMRDAATALGLTPYQMLTHVEWPLALPVILGGLRTAAVASVGLAAVTALIGAGGLGSILFEGLFSNAQDLVLLGVLPIVALGMLVDALFKWLISLARHKARA